MENQRALERQEENVLLTGGALSEGGGMSRAWMACMSTQRGAAVGVPSLPGTGIFLGKACPSAQRPHGWCSTSSSPLGMGSHCSALQRDGVLQEAAGLFPAALQGCSGRLCCSPSSQGVQEGRIPPLDPAGCCTKALSLLRGVWVSANSVS